MAETEETHSETASLEQELQEAEARMAEIKANVTEELIRDWPSPWRNEAMTGAKVTGRLSSHKEYQSLLQRTRELQRELGVTAKPRETEEAEDPMGSYAMKLAKAAREKGQ